MIRIQFDGSDLQKYKGDILLAVREAHRLLSENLSILRGGGNRAEEVRRFQWFGNTAPWYVQSRLQKLFDVLDDDARTLTFVDARQKVNALGEICGLKLKVSYKPDGPGQNVKVSHNAGDYLSDADYAFVHPVPRGCFAPNKGPIAHVGSGMRMYLGPAFFRADEGPIERPQTVVHELTHKVLGTVDWDANGDAAYGVKTCLDLARRSPAQALRNADSWAYYVTALSHNWAAKV
jgi:hypothetical protein